ncbi:hypothetical protein ACJU26_08955 [Acidithiobacillus sp. M4-SHS-6]|uniref:hypothetical protein n=1 Tax=Acidithiobacillus sp. M4-SHS-6 TaxID=3383024 RepID=UPI0039BE7CFE
MDKGIVKKCWEQFLQDGFECATSVILTIARHFVPICRRQGNTEAQVLDRLLYALDWDDEEEGANLVRCIDENGHYDLYSVLSFWLGYPRGGTVVNCFMTDSDEEFVRKFNGKQRQMRSEAQRNGIPLIISSHDNVLSFQSNDARLRVCFFRMTENHQKMEVPSPYGNGLITGRPLMFRESGNWLLNRLESHWGDWPGYLKAELSGFV